MTALPAYKYRDPSEVLESEEKRRCAGCKWKARFLGVDMCRHPHRTGKAEKRCSKYDTGEGK